MSETKPATVVELVEVTRPGTDTDAVRDLFLEYGASLGFTACEPYYDNACAGSDCFEIAL